MLSIPHSLVKFFDAVLLRILIFAFCFLSYQFATMFISASAEMHPYMAMWSNILFEATVIIILNLRYGTESIGRDVNTLKAYAVLLHLAYIPFYFNDIDVGIYHDYGVRGINGLIVLRLFYFGKRDLLARIAIIEHSKKWLLDSRWFVNSYINGLTIAVFTICAIPLCTMIYIINTDQMRVTGIAIILFAFFTAIENSSKIRAANAAKSTLAAAAVAKGSTATIAAQHADAKELVEAKERIKDLTGHLKTAGGVIAAGYFICFLMVQGEGQKKFLFGYAFGFADGKSGVKPKAEVRLERLVKCFDRGDGGGGRPPPPDPACKDLFETELLKSVPPKIAPAIEEPKVAPPKK